MDQPPPREKVPRAFGQGVGLLFQMIGGTIFLVSFFICCGSGLLSKDTATQSDLTRIGWHMEADQPDHPSYSAQRALTISLFATVFFGLATASSGLGMQSDHRNAASMAAVATFVATIFYLVHALFAATGAHSAFFTIVGVALTILFGTMFGFALVAVVEMRRNPPPRSHDILPADYKIPYSHYHDDPPEVRLAAELEQRRQRIAIQQKELEMLEERLKQKLEEDQPKKDQMEQK